MLPFPKRAEFSYRAEDVDRVFNDHLYIDIINSKVFRRLKLVSFLGAIEYVLRPSSIYKYFVHSRFNHSIGVARLALRYSYIRGFSKVKERGLVVYALVHDLGHFPLSHTLEDISAKKFAMNHRLFSIALVNGELEEQKELKDILNHYKICSNSITHYFDTETAGEASVSSPFNLDTLEGISRSYQAFSRNHVRLDASRLLKNTLVVRSAIHRQMFWASKAQIYNKVIYGPIGMAADVLSSLYFSETKKDIDIDDMTANDHVFFTRHPDFVEFMKKISKFLLNEYVNLPSPVRRRYFLIDDVGAGETDERYQSTKVTCLDNLDAWKALFYRIYESEVPDSTQLELFSDDGGNC
jgi:HD superfamily phosphohydrolase